MTASSSVISSYLCLKCNFMFNQKVVTIVQLSETSKTENYPYTYSFVTKSVNRLQFTENYI